MAVIVPVVRRRTSVAFSTLLCLLAFGMGASPLRAAPLFGPPSPFPVPHIPDQIEAADVNLDGKLDLVVATRFADSVCVSLGNGDGTFQTPLCYATGGGNISVTVADVNSDNQPELITANYGYHTMSILFGPGDGTFPSHIDYPAGRWVEACDVLDIDNDVDMDIVSSASGTFTLNIFDGNGSGSFAPALVYGTAIAPSTLRHADLNQDGLPDLVVRNFSSGNMGVYFNGGVGTFGVRYDVPCSTPTWVETGDLNGDGFPDVVTGSDVNRYLSVSLNTQVFPYLAGAVDVPMVPYTSSIEILDANGDGKLDLVSASPIVDSVAVALGNGDGTFQDAMTFEAGSGSSRLAAGDFDGDGRIDLACTNPGGSRFVILLNTGGVIAAVGSSEPRTIRQLDLAAPAPNPTMDRSAIRFRLGWRARVSVEVFDMQGRRVRTLSPGRELEPGDHRIEWDGRDQRGAALAAGVYTVLVKDGKDIATRKVTITR